MDSYYFALIAQGIEFYSKVIFSVVSWYSKCRLYFIKGGIEESCKEREGPLCVCVLSNAVFVTPGFSRVFSKSA